MIVVVVEFQIEILIDLIVDLLNEKLILEEYNKMLYLWLQKVIFFHNLYDYKMHLMVMELIEKIHQVNLIQIKLKRIIND